MSMERPAAWRLLLLKLVCTKWQPVGHVGASVTLMVMLTRGSAKKCLQQLL
jgi:hypothetical protein